MSEKWKPIESAPKDGTRVLVSNGKYVVIAYWNTEPLIWEDGGNNTQACWTVFEPDDFYYAWHLLGDGGPTSWQPVPLPPPPESET